MRISDWSSTCALPICREAQDEYALESQKRTAIAQQAGKFDDEIVPMPTKMAVVNKETKEVSYKDIALARDEGNRPDTNAEGLASLQPVRGQLGRASCRERVCQYV